MPEPNEQDNQTQDGNEQEQGESVDGLKNALKAERDARRTAEKAHKDLAKRLADLENAGKSEVQQLRERLDAMTAENREAKSKEALREAAIGAGAAANADKVYRFVKADLRYAEDGSIENLADLIADAKKSEPGWFRASPGKSDGGNGNRQAPTDNKDWVRQALAARRGG